MTLSELYTLIKKKSVIKDTNSYTASLFREGEDRIIQKVGEEAVEVVIAAKNSDKNELLYETADLLYHLTVLLVSHDITFDEIENELSRRHLKKKS